MAYDSAHGQMVLFGGEGDSLLGDTWTWDGVDWTEHTPAHSPLPRSTMGMVYDGARNQVVLFGGCCSTFSGDFGDTWTWDGADWTEYTPAHSPLPRSTMGMVSDGARNQVVLFGGCCGNRGTFGDTWTWDGTDWTKRRPAHSPSKRFKLGMAYDAARGQGVLFGGTNFTTLGDTWTWDGTDWTKRTPAHSPPPRENQSMAYDAARGQVVLFGGDYGSVLGDTWTWDGTDWTRHFSASIQLHPRSGPPATLVHVLGSGFVGGERVRLVFADSTQGRIFLRRVQTDSTGAFSTQITIPSQTTPGTQRVKARGLTSGKIAVRRFTVT
jgi:hypothetical protein